MHHYNTVLALFHDGQRTIQTLIREKVDLANRLETSAKIQQDLCDNLTSLHEKLEQQEEANIKLCTEHESVCGTMKRAYEQLSIQYKESEEARKVQVNELAARSNRIWALQQELTKLQAGK